MAERRFMEFITSPTCTQVAANDVITQPIRLPTSQTETLAMLIHKVIFDLDGWAPPVSTTEVTMRLALVKSINLGLAADYRWIDTIAAFEHTVRAVGVLTEEVISTHSPFVVDFAPAVLIARDILFAHSEAANMPAAAAARIRIGYTLEKVTQAAFIAALVS